MLIRYFIALALLLVTLPAFALDVSFAGVIGGKAILIIGSKTRTVAVGQTTPEGVKLLSLSGENITVEVGETQRSLRMGQQMGTGITAEKAKAVIQADGRGQFYTEGSINGRSTRMVVDTGATYVAMSGTEAKRLGIDYTKGVRSMTSTANGVVPAYTVTLDNVKVGDIQYYQVTGSVIEGNSPPVVLLGMSFLSRVQMQREGMAMTLIKSH